MVQKSTSESTSCIGLSFTKCLQERYCTELRSIKAGYVQFSSGNASGDTATKL